MPPDQRATSETPIRVIIEDTVLIGRLWDNATARDLIAQLPLTLTFRDFNRVEKIAQLPGSYHWMAYRQVMTRSHMTSATTILRATSSSTTTMSATSPASCGSASSTAAWM